MERIGIELINTAFGYSRRAVLENVSLRYEEGEFLGILGPNGSGKSTLIKGLLGLIRPLKGEIRVRVLAGAGMPQQLRSLIGYVPQRSELDRSFPVSVMDVVLMGTYGGLGLLRRPGEDERNQVRQVLDQLGMGQLANRPLRQLSGGQFQRVLVARALVGGARILVLDEPTAGIDQATEREIFEFLSELHRSHGMSIIVVSHNMGEVVKRADKVVVFGGKVMVCGPPAEVFDAEEIRRTMSYSCPSA